MKILFTSSSGGHLEELLQLKKIIINNDSFILTEKNQNKLSLFKKKIVINQINRREKHFYLHFFKLILFSRKVLKTIKPDLIISTGALVTVPVCIIGKMMNIKVVYIESFARIYKPSLTGKIMYRIADVFIVQWKELLEYFPKAKFFGGIF